MKRMSMAAAAALIVSSLSVSAQEQPEGAEPQDAAEADADEAKADEKKICRTQRSTGSLTRRSRICMTRAQWQELSDRTRQGVDEMQGSASGSRVTPVCDASGSGPGCQPFGVPVGSPGSL